MYLGEIVELAPTCILFQEPKHPYTRALIASIPVPDPSKKKNLKLVEGEVPSPINPPSGCSFHPRCKEATENCKTEPPFLLDLGNGHQVRCHLYKNKVKGVETSVI
jgi:peptide/nickel transport system ATP-binding protein/oligopeptide transport system ATP-binding protein